jgi:hypothetical protein
VITTHPLVASAIDQVTAVFGDDAVLVESAPDGGVWVTLKDRDLGPGWAPHVVDVSVKLLPTYPTTPPYPFYVTTGLARADGGQVPNLNEVEVDGRRVGQLSLNKPFDAGDDLAARLVAVLDWLRQR